MSRATLGFSRVTRARTRQNLYPRPRARVFAGMGSGFMKTRGYPNPHRGMPPEMTNKPRKGSASVNRHCRATLRGSESQGMVTGAQGMQRFDGIVLCGGEQLRHACDSLALTVFKALVCEVGSIGRCRCCGE